MDESLGRSSGFSQDESPRQFLNRFLASASLERRNAIAYHMPVEVHLQIASTCNLDCIMCSEHLTPLARRTRAQRYLEPALFDKIERDLLPYCSTLDLGVGGEPLASPHFADYVERAAAQGVEISLLTNGTLMRKPATVDRIARTVSRLSVSIDGATRTTYERIRRGARFDHLVESIERFNVARERSTAPQRTQLRFCLTLMRSNVHELVDYVELAAALGAEEVAAWHVIPITDEAEHESLIDDVDMAREWCARARARAAELGVVIRLPAATDGHGAEASRSTGHRPDRPRGESLREVDRDRSEATDAEAAPTETVIDELAEVAVQPTHCRVPTISAYILWDGRVFACGHPLVHRGEAIGNLADQSFEEIWNGRTLRNLRAGLLERDMPTICRGCSIACAEAPESADAEAAPDAGHGIDSYFGSRDLAPLQGTIAIRDLLDDSESSGLATSIQTMTGNAKLAHRHIGAIERENAALRGHVANIERENAALRGHVANLEERVDVIRGEVLYKQARTFRELIKKLVP